MSNDAIGIGEPFPPGISAKDRRWALLQWLSAKLQQAPYEEILDAARQFEKYIVGDIEGRGARVVPWPRIAGAASQSATVPNVFRKNSSSSVMVLRQALGAQRSGGRNRRRS